MKRSSLLCFLLVFNLFALAQDMIIEQSYPDTMNFLPGLSAAFDIQEASNGGYVVLGATDFPTGAIRHNIRLLKVDEDLNLQWDSTYWRGEVIAQEGRALAILSDESYVIAGYNNNQPYSMRIAPNLDTLWTHTFGSPGGSFEAVAVTAEEDLIFGGWTVVGPANVGLLRKTDEDGDFLWNQSFTNYQIRSLAILSDGSFISGGAFGAQGQIAKHDAAGNILWTQVVAFSKADAVNDVEVLDDGSIVFAAEGSGFAGPIPFGGKLSANGEILWTAFVSQGLGKGTAVSVIEENAMVIVGSLTNYWLSDQPGFSEAIDQSGMNIEGSFEFLAELATASSVITDSEGCVVLAGVKESSFYLRKNCEDIINTVENIESDNTLKLYPNPSKETIYLEVAKPISKALAWEMYNPQGQLLQQGKVSDVNASINVASLPKGMYFLKVYAENVLLKPFVIK